MSKMLFADLLIEKDGLIKGPFGGDIKKSLFVPQTKDTFKVYEQGVVLKNDINYGTYYISKVHFESKLKRFEVKKGDLLMTGAGTLGEILTVPENAPKGVINQALLRIRLNESVVSATFFKYYFKYYIKAIISRINGDSVIPNLPPLPLIRNTEVDIPDTIYQNKIASVLSALDSKIELNNRINAELEAMAKTIYDYWFVQFDFPFDFAQGKPDKNGKPYKSSGGKMVWNEELKREIPEGWEVKDLQEIAMCLMGQSPKGESYNQDGIGTPLLNGPADYENGALKGRTYTTEPTRLCQKDDLVLCIRATIGNLVYSEQEFCLGRGVAAVRANDKRLSELIYFLLIQEIERFKVQATGSIIVGITKDDLIESKCLLPKDELITSFHNLIKPQFDKIRINIKENQKLTELRDWLLPMLMNGQVKVN